MAETLAPALAPNGLRIEGLRLFRHLAGLTQRELAKRVGVNPSTISDLERGTMSPRLSTARRLLQVLRAPSIEALFPDPPLGDGRGRRAAPARPAPRKADPPCPLLSSCPTRPPGPRSASSARRRRPSAIRG